MPHNEQPSRAPEPATAATPPAAEPIYRSVFQIEVFTVRPFDPYEQMDHYNGDEQHTVEGRELGEILSDTYEHGTPTRYYQVASHQVADEDLGEWAEFTRENSNIFEQAYGYIDGVPYSVVGEYALGPKPGVVDLADLWVYREQLHGGGRFSVCSCGYPITRRAGQWFHIFSPDVTVAKPTAHQAAPM